MFFGRVPPLEAEGAILAHQVKAGDAVFKKGHRLREEDCAALHAARIPAITIARLEAGDVEEDEAAASLAGMLKGPGLRIDAAFTGRANLFAEAAGLFLVDAARIHAFNRLDDALTLATLPPYKRVAAGEMVATIKIIPFALPGALVEAGKAALGAGALALSPFRPRRVGMIALTLPSLKESVLDKTCAVTKARVEALGGSLAFEARVPHEEAALGAALAALDPETYDILLIFGAAAITDRRDVVPRAVEAQGGAIIHLGMPVDPGNLLLLAELHNKPVIGAPGCARSPRENGFDWVLARLFADVPVSRADLQAMGVGGLLMEIISRPQPRAGKSAHKQEHDARVEEVAALVLAAGRSTRFGAENKLLALYEGKPMVQHALDMARAAGLRAITLVTGHEAERVKALVGEGVTLIHNPGYAMGLSSSLKAGIAALPAHIGAVVLLLGDMPLVKGETLAALLAAARANGEAQAFVPVHAGRWGNPVLLRRALFPSLLALNGDQGARKLLEAARDLVCEVPVEDAGILADFDTREALLALSDPSDGKGAA